MTTLEDYLLALHTRQLILLYCAMLKDDVRGALLLLTWIDARVCCAPANHRQEFRYAGNGHFICSICERMMVSAV